MRNMLSECSPAGYTAACQAIRDVGLTNDLKQIAANTLVIGGTLDTATPLHHSDLLGAEINHAQIEWLATAHLSNIERSKEFSALVDRFLHT